MHGCFHAETDQRSHQTIRTRRKTIPAVMTLQAKDRLTHLVHNSAQSGIDEREAVSQRSDPVIRSVQRRMQDFEVRGRENGADTHVLQNQEHVATINVILHRENL